MNFDRRIMLFALAGVVAVLALVRFFWPDGLITLDFKNAPLSKVIASIERQGRVRIATNVPPDTLVTIQMQRAPLMEALETLSVRVEGELRAVFVGAPTKIQAAAALEELKSGKRSDQWVVAWTPSMGLGASPPDPRLLAVKPEPGEKNDLQSALRQVAAKSGVMTAIPGDWNPPVKMPTKTAPASTLVKQLIQSSGGQVQESFLIVAREDRGEGRPREGGGRWEGPRFSREGMNPEWMAQRVEAAIGQLPPEERPAAKEEFAAMKKFWEEVRALPDDQRREKMEEFFNRPEVQEKMEERTAARDARRSPEQRAQRYKQYIERRNQGGKPQS